MKKGLVKKTTVGLSLASILLAGNLLLDHTVKAQEMTTNYINYELQQGDYLYKIGKKFGVSVDELMQWNNLKAGYMLHPGDVLRVETSSVSQPNSTYTVQQGDYLYKIAKKFGVTVNDLKQWNNLGRIYMLHPGDQLLIKATQSNNTSSNSTSGSYIPEPQMIPTHMSAYSVRPGDSLWGISRRFGVTLNNLMQWNNLSSGVMLHPNDTLMVKVDELSWTTNSDNTEELISVAFNKIQAQNGGKFTAPNYTYTGDRIDDNTVEVKIYDNHAERMTLNSVYQYNKATNRVEKQMP